MENSKSTPMDSHLPLRRVAQNDVLSEMPPFGTPRDYARAISLNVFPASRHSKVSYKMSAFALLSLTIVHVSGLRTALWGVALSSINEAFDRLVILSCLSLRNVARSNCRRAAAGPASGPASSRGQSIRCPPTNTLSAYTQTQ